MLLLLLLVRSSHFLLVHPDRISVFSRGSAICATSTTTSKPASTGQLPGSNSREKIQIPEKMDKTICSKSLLKEINWCITRCDISAALSLLRNSQLSCKDTNYIATRMITSLSDKGHRDHIYDALRSVGMIYGYNNTACCPDPITYTTAMSTLARHGRLDETLQIFQEMKATGVEMDEISYSCAMRAFAFTKPWKDTINLLEESYVHFSQGSLHVVHTAMTNLKYGRFQNALQQESALWRLNSLIEWMNSRRIVPCIQTMDIILAVLGKHGAAGDVEIVSSLLLSGATDKSSLSKYTFNAILQNCVNDGDNTGALHVLQKMSEFDFLPDETSFNSILKMVINSGDDEGVEHVLNIMKQKGIERSDYTTSLLMAARKHADNPNAIMEILDRKSSSSSSTLSTLSTQSSTEITPHMYCNAISACGSDWFSALKIFNHAKTMKKLDTAIFISTAKVCVSNGKHDEGYDIITLMIQDNLPISKHSLSFVIDFCLSEYIASNKKGIAILKRYLQSTEVSNPELLTGGICQSVLERVLRLDEPEVACDLHLSTFENLSCKAQTLQKILAGMQKLSEEENKSDSPVAIEYKRALGRKSLELIRRYCTRRSYDKSSDERRKSLHSIHFDSVLRTLVLAKMFEAIGTLFALMSGNDTTVQKYRWRPGIFTVAEFIRAAKLSRNPVMALDVIKWALIEETPLPFGVVSDAVSYVYNEGRTDIAYEMYRNIYDNDLIQHWSHIDALEIDLHKFSRGMAYSSIRCVFNEILQKAEWSKMPQVPLTIITGKNVKSRKPITSTTTENGDEDNNSTDQYRISQEIQNILVEDFYPPVSSSTSPGNTGRLLIDLQDIRKLMYSSST